MTVAATLQPPSSTALMVAVSEVNAARHAAFPADLVGVAWDAEACPPALLDWLANALSVDIWEPAWGELRKRAAIVASPRLHQLKGTLEGIAAHLVEAGADLRQAVTPSDRMFATPTVDKATRDAWLARMPQIRVYLARREGEAGADGFADDAFAGDFFARFDAAETIYGRFATLVDGDDETPLPRAHVETTTVQDEALQLDRVFIPGTDAPALFADSAFAGDAYMTGPLIPPRIVTFATSRTYSHAQSRTHLDTVGDGLQPALVAQERVTGDGEAILEQFAGDGAAGLDGSFAMADRAPWLIYDRILLQDDKRDAPWVAAHSFAGHVRLGPPAFTATLLVDAPGSLQAGAAVARSWIVGEDFTAPHDVTAFNAALDAVRLSKAHRDCVLVDTTITRPRTFGDRIPLDGSHRLGGSVSRKL